MNSGKLPVLYSFRRCPYAMRARLALLSSGQVTELREVVLREKPADMLQASPKGTVPVLVLQDGTVLEESLDVMGWALRRDDPEGLRAFPQDVCKAMDELVAESDGPFKSALDRYKYPNRYDGTDRAGEREKGAAFIGKLDGLLDGQPHLFGERISFADIAILPFVRQFAHVDRGWFWAQDWPNVLRWLDVFLESDRFKHIMTKHAQWQSGEEGVRFGG